ncbi:harmonin isoform X2 [Cylas formicarius]|uniref:harmonin isoform X2 n=1 Tax=Cylas formicarius TaxID=197179 RepID=UPI002958588C|nr:harmonin isoform X2 [Cylas formicarius]
MLTVDYATVNTQQHKYACSTMSSETLSGSCGSRNNRIRTVRLVRPSHGPLPPPTSNCRHGPSLGFSIRGGREHGTGFFVSHVDVGSEAYSQGLRSGDQIIRINGFTVDDAVHKEVLQLISNHTHLTLKVRGVGMIPVKEKTDTLSWQIISDAASPAARHSPQLSDKINDVRINVMVAPKSKLGCGICKGPEWKPGIFVQFTKEGGIAREAGLRPGDQILFCNNVDFSDIPFNEAVSIMKSVRQLNLIIRKGAGSELFPGESSGYNSSASSVTGDQSPSWSDSKRLSIVKEENLDLGERLNHLDRYKNLSNTKHWDSWDEEPEDKPLFKPTIISLSESGTTIQNNGAQNDNPDCHNKVSRCNTTNNSNNKLADICLISQQHEMKTVVVEVHRTDTDEPKTNNHNTLTKSPSTSSFYSVTSKSSCTGSVASSLSSAITQEIQRRSQKKITEEPKQTIDEQIQIKKILKGVSTDQQFQHNKLMDEFKRAHQRMFKVPDSKKSSDNPIEMRNGDSDKENVDRLNNNKNSNELSNKLSERLSNLNIEEPQNERLTHNKQSFTTSAPPPPPPLPQDHDHSTSSIPSTPSTLSSPSSSTSSTRSNTLKNNKTKPKAPPVPVKYSVLSYQQPPPCPTPDYDTLSLASTTSSGTAVSKSTFSNNSTETLRSARADNRLEQMNYVQKRIISGQLSTPVTKSNGTLIKKRPVSVTIGEYPSMRRQPGKLDFLQNGDRVDYRRDESISSRLTSELTQTLNRSNLKKRTESMEDLLSSSHIRPQSNGTVRISLSNLSKSFAKSTSDLTLDHCDLYPNDLGNRVTININQPNGILKNGGNASTLSSPLIPAHKTLSSQKSITFGEMPTLIKDRSPPPLT